MVWPRRTTITTLSASGSTSSTSAVAPIGEVSTITASATLATRGSRRAVTRARSPGLLPRMPDRSSIARPGSSPGARMSSSGACSTSCRLRPAGSALTTPRRSLSVGRRKSVLTATVRSSDSTSAAATFAVTDVLPSDGPGEDDDGDAAAVGECLVAGVEEGDEAAQRAVRVRQRVVASGDHGEFAGAVALDLGDAGVGFEAEQFGGLLAGADATVGPGEQQATPKPTAARRAPPSRGRRRGSGVRRGQTLRWRRGWARSRVVRTSWPVDLEVVDC